MSTTHDARTGEVPADQSREACEARAFAMHSTACASADLPEQWESIHDATLEQKCNRLATVTTGKHEFARSLAQQFKDKGTLSEKQLSWVHRLYREYAERNAIVRRVRSEHEWTQVGSITHYDNPDLGTFAVTKFHKCDKCGEWGETYRANAYSGD